MNGIEPRLQYIYAKIMKATRQCVGVFTSTNETTEDAYFEYVPLEHLDNSYMRKYYIDGTWYEDAAGTIPWTPTT